MLDWRFFFFLHTIPPPVSPPGVPMDGWSMVLEHFAAAGGRFWCFDVKAVLFVFASVLDTDVFLIRKLLEILFCS